MKKTLPLLFVIAFSLQAFAANVTYNIIYQDSARSFTVHLPPGFSNVQHLPMVINMHGLGSNGGQQEFYSKMSATADANNFVVVYPNGLSNSWNSGFQLPYNSRPDDVGFISKIIDTLYALYNIDLTRVYATGMSNGGFQSARLACDLENRIAAIATVTGTIAEVAAANCVLARKVPVLHIHGTADPLVPYAGTTGIKSVEETISFWLTKNQCSTTSDTIRYPDVDPNDSSTVERIRYATCNSGVEVVFYKITGGGHTWPDAPIPFIYGPTNHDFDASQEIWDFFERYTLNGPVNGIDEVKTEMSISVYPNPGEGNYQLSVIGYNFEKPLQATVFDISGKKIMEQQVSSETVVLKLNEVNAGMYFLQLAGPGFNASKRIVKE